MVEKGSEAATETKQAQEDELLSYLQLMEGDFGEMCRTTMCQKNLGLSEEKGKAACLFTSLCLCCISLVRMFSKDADSPTFSFGIVWHLQRWVQKPGLLSVRGTWTSWRLKLLEPRLQWKVTEAIQNPVLAPGEGSDWCWRMRWHKNLRNTSSDDCLEQI